MKLTLTNKNGQILDLVNSKHRFILFRAEALHGIETSIGESESPYIDGSEIDMIKALPRGIELGFKLVGNVKDAINYFTSFVKSKQYVTLTEVEGDRKIEIKGVATITPYTRMVAACELTLTVYCGQPYWEDVENVVGVISRNIDLLCFPTEGQYFEVTGRPFGEVDTDLEKTFINDGDATVGMEFTMVALNTVNYPKISCSSGEQNGWFMELNVILDPNDILFIRTVKGQKEILINGSGTYNGQPVLNYLTFSGNDWLQLETGENTFNISSRSQETSIYFNVVYKRRYE